MFVCLFILSFLQFDRTEIVVAQSSQSTSDFPVSVDVLWNNSVVDITDKLPSDGNVTGIIETKNYVLLRTSKGVWKSTDGMKTWRKVLDITDTKPEGYNDSWPVFKKIDNKIFVSYIAPAHYLHVSIDDGETWSNNLVSNPVNELIKLPNGTFLVSLWSENDGGIIMKSNDGTNWQIAFNVTEIGQSLGWLSGSERHRHAHHVHYDSQRGVLIVTGGESYNETYGVDIERVYYSTDMGKTWHLGPYFSVVEIISTPQTIMLGPDNNPDVAFWNGSTEHAEMTRWLRNNDLDRYVFRCLYKNGVLYIACRSVNTFAGYGIIATADFKSYVVLKKIDKPHNGGFDLFDGYGDYFYAVYWGDDGQHRLYKIRAFTKSEIEALSTTFTTDQPHYYYYDLKNAKLRIYGKNVTNLLPNPSFEDGWESKPYGFLPSSWGLSNNVPTGNYTITNSTDALFGTYSVKIEANFSAGGTYTQIYSPLIDVENNTTYTLSVYFKLNGTGDWGETKLPSYSIYQYNSTGGVVSAGTTGATVVSSLKLNVTTESWQRFIVQFKTNPETVQVRIYIGVSGTSGSYAVWLDGIQLQKGEASPFIIGEQMTTNPKINVNGRWFNYTGTLNEGEYVEFDFGDAVGVFNITQIVEGSKVANVTIVGTKIATYTNISFIDMYNDIPIGIYYGTFTISQVNIAILTPSHPNKYANITQGSFVDQRLHVVLEGPTGVTGTTVIYCPYDPIVIFEDGELKTTGYTWNPDTKLLTVNVTFSSPVELDVYFAVPRVESHKVEGEFLGYVFPGTQTVKLNLQLYSEGSQVSQDTRIILEVYSSDGALIYTTAKRETLTQETKTVAFNIPDLEPGIYLVKITLQNPDTGETLNTYSFLLKVTYPWWLWLTAIIAAIGIATVIMYKKKRKTFSLKERLQHVA